MRDSVGKGVVVCCVFNVDGVVVDVVCVCEKCEVWVMWKLHDIVCVAEGVEPMVALVGVVAVLDFELEFGGEEGGGAGHVACSEGVGDAGGVTFNAEALKWDVGKEAVGADPSFAIVDWGGCGCSCCFGFLVLIFDGLYVCAEM